MAPKKTLIAKNIIHLEYPDQLSLGRAMVRFQESYESPQFKGQVFTLGQFREYYTAMKGEWSYYDDWAGYNVPGRVFEPFWKGLFDPLTSYEQEVIDLIGPREDEFYLIATYVGAASDIYPHEVAHAMFATIPAYRAEVLEAISSCRMEDFGDLYDHFTELGYHDDVYVDEAHAYLSASTDYLKAMEIPYPQNVADKLSEIRFRYLKGELK